MTEGRLILPARPQWKGHPFCTRDAVGSSPSVGSNALEAYVVTHLTRNQENGVRFPARAYAAEDSGGLGRRTFNPEEHVVLVLRTGSTPVSGTIFGTGLTVGRRTLNPCSGGSNPPSRANNWATEQTLNRAGACSARLP